MNEAELLFTEILNCDRTSLYLRGDTLLDKERSFLISRTLKRRMRGEPIQYILGKTEFMGLEFKIDRGVLIPRPETEILVETAIGIARSYDSGSQDLAILDIGTGSGCIAVSLAVFIHNANIAASDISPSALKIAQENAVSHRVSGRIKFIQQDLFNTPGNVSDCYDIIVSNPPYIATSEIDKLAPEIRYEPRIALDGGRDGLDFYRYLIPQGKQYLRKGGFLILEIGCNQGEAIEDILDNCCGLKIRETVKDYNHIDRVMVIQKT